MRDNNTASSVRFAWVKVLAVYVILAGGILCSSLVSSVEARPGMAGKEGLAARFATMDTDKNGFVSREEFAAALPQMRDTAFDAMDTDKDGQLSVEEWQQAMTEHMGMMSMPPAGGKKEQGSDTSGTLPGEPELLMPTKSAP